jgi:hypothetical protein
MDRQQIRDKLERSVGGADKLANFFSARTMGDLNKRAARELDDGADTVISALDCTRVALEREGLADYAPDPQAFIDGFVSKFAAFQFAGSRTANWAVTGPARFPVASNNRKMDSEHKRLGEMLDYAKEAPARAVKAAKRARAQALGADGVVAEELLDLKTRLEKREASQRHMKAINELIRRHKLGEGDGATLAALATERGFPMNANRAGMVLKPPYPGCRGGYERFQLSNNLAEIKRLQGRIAQVEAKAQRVEAAEEVERTVNGVQVIEANADDRLRLVFDGKPPRETIQLLKSNGFRWSPTNGAWQRQLTPNARYAAERVLNQLAA